MAEKITPKAVIFDMMGVVMGNDPEPQRELSAALIELKENAGDDFLAALRDAETGKTSLAEFLPILHEAVSKLPSKPNMDLFQWGRLALFNGSKDLMNKSVLEAIPKLKRKGLKTAVLTNNFWVDKEKTNSLLPIDASVFDIVVESCRVGHAKPEKFIYELVCKKLHCAEQEAILLEEQPALAQAGVNNSMFSIRVADQAKAIAYILELLEIEYQDDY